MLGKLALTLGSATGLLLAYVPVHANSSLQITEVMYNPAGNNTGRQWFEVRNVGTEAVDLGAKDMRVVDAHGKHLIKITSGGSSLAPGTLAVIADNPAAFSADYPTYAGMLLKSSFSLTSSGTIQIAQTDGTVLTQASYSSDDGAKNDGNSLQLSEGAFVAGAPTPGVYTAAPPAPLAPAKPSAAAPGSTNRGATSQPQVLTDSAYDPGITAPTTAATAPVVGALSQFFVSADPLLSTPWFSAFLALLAFSAFSLILITRYA